MTKTLRKDSLDSEGVYVCVYVYNHVTKHITTNFLKQLDHLRSLNTSLHKIPVFING